ncbi:MAG: GDP-L-fucose synthase [Flavobacteriaceae bacterium]
MNKNTKIYIAGHRGLVGSAIVKELEAKGYTNLIFRTHKELDLTSQQAVADFFAKEKPEYVFLAAAKVGGIVANNTYRADFIYENLMIQNNVIHQSYLHGIKKLLFLGSTCIYPKECPQPMKEEYLLTSPLEYTNEPYAIAKIAGIKMCESYNIQYGTNFIAVQPTNLYGPNDNFNLEKSHVLPALLRKVHLGKALDDADWITIRSDLNKLPIEGVDGNATEDEILQILSKYGVRYSKDTSHFERSREISQTQKDQDSRFNSEYSRGEISRGGVEVEIWGSGNPMREFLWSEDMANACIYLMENIDFKDIVEKERHSESRVLEMKEYSQLNNEIRNTHINIGTGKEISIKELAEIIKEVIGFQGNFYFNTTKPDGTMRKLTDTTKLRH